MLTALHTLPHLSPMNVLHCEHYPPPFSPKTTDRQEGEAPRAYGWKDPRLPSSSQAVVEPTTPTSTPALLELPCDSGRGVRKPLFGFTAGSVIGSAPGAQGGPQGGKRSGPLSSLFASCPFPVPHSETPTRSNFTEPLP